MKAKESNAQLEVWQWKEKVYNQIKDLPLDKGIELIMEQTKQLAESLKKKYVEKIKSRQNN